MRLLWPPLRYFRFILILLPRLKWAFPWRACPWECFVHTWIDAYSCSTRSRGFDVSLVRHNKRRHSLRFANRNLGSVLMATSQEEVESHGFFILVDWRIGDIRRCRSSGKTFSSVHGVVSFRRVCWVPVFLLLICFFLAYLPQGCISSCLDPLGDLLRHYFLRGIHIFFL